MSEMDDIIGRLREACRPGPHRYVLADRHDLTAALDALDKAHHQINTDVCTDCGGLRDLGCPTCGGAAG